MLIKPTAGRVRRPPSASPQGRATPALTLLLVAGIGLLLAAIFPTEVERLSIRPLSLLLIGSAVLIGGLIQRAVRGRGHSLAFLLFVVLCFFHLGLYLQPALTGQMPARLGSIVYETHWYNQATLARSGLVVLLGLLAYATAIGVVTWVFPRFRARPEDPEPDDRHYSRRVAAALSDVGAALLVLGVGAWYAISIAALGPGFAFRDYLSYLSATADEPLPLVYLVISVGTVLAAVRLRRGAGVVAALAFGLFALPAFLIGLRGEVLIPAVAAVPVLFRDPRNRALEGFVRRPAARVAMAAALIVLLIGISLVQQVRQSGIQSLGRPADHRVSALAAVQEMGYTVRVVATSISWHENLHEPYARGATYLAPLTRPVQRALGLPRLDAKSDFGLMNVEIATRIGPIGGSMIGEAHHNFGRAGAVGMLMLVGALASVVDRPRMGAWRTAWLGAVGLLTLMHVRNSFAPMVAWALASALAIAGAVVLSRFYQARNRP